MTSNQENYKDKKMEVPVDETENMKSDKKDDKSKSDTEPQKDKAAK